MATKPLQIIMSERALGLVAEAAESAGCKSSTWARQTLYTALRALGFDPTPVTPSDAGSLYDVVDGRQRYAWVDGDSIKSVSYHDAKPEHDSRKWLPVVHQDSEPFDDAIHWRLKPDTRIESDRVVVTYPIVMKTEGV